MSRPKGSKNKPKLKNIIAEKNTSGYHRAQETRT